MKTPKRKKWKAVRWFHFCLGYIDERCSGMSAPGDICRSPMCGDKDIRKILMTEVE